MRRMWTRAVLVGALGLAAGGSFGCASERDPISRVQPNALAKSFFVGNDLQGTLDDPEFYEQATLVDVGYGASQEGLFTSTYAQPLARIKWQITENLLIGRLTYQRIADSDGKGAGPTASDGVIAVAYRIQSHFDIKRDYNPATGEQTNVVVENSTDRAWNEREYMRVDWSQNVNTDSYDFDMLSLLGVFGGVTYEPLSYYVNDPNDENAPHFDPDTGYFDITSKAFATPQLTDLSAIPGAPAGKMPLCDFNFSTLKGTAPAGSCDPVELTIRQSFKRVVDDDYEPVDYDGHRFQAFGAFTTDRFGYARDYGMTDASWHRFIDRYNIWDKSHYYSAEGKPVQCYTPTTLAYSADPHLDADQDGTEDACAAVTAATGFSGSKCDTFKQRCTLPYRARTEKPIVWYYTKGSNTQFFDGTDWAAHEWDVAMRGAVVTAKYAECVRSGDAAQCAQQYPMYTGQMEDNWDARELAKEVDDCRHRTTHPELQGVEASCQALATSIGTARGYSPGVIAIASMPEMVVLCHSPVEANDPAPCAAPDQRLPPGMAWTACAQADIDRLDPSKDQNAVSATLGVCNSAVYPRRGDLRYNQINALVPPQTPSPWGIMVDSDDPLTGEKVATSVNVWTHVNDVWSQNVIDNVRYLKGEIQTADITDGAYINNWATAAQAAGGNGVLPLLSKDDVDQKLADFNKMSVPQMKRIAAAGRSPAAEAVIANVHARMANVVASATVASTNEIAYNSRRASAIAADPTFEAALMSGPVLQYSGFNKTTPVTDDVLQQASPLRGANRSFWRNVKQARDLALAQRGACIMEDEDAPAPFSVAALADVLEQKFGAFNPADSADVQQARAERMRLFLAQRAQYAVIAHEMGHSIGLRHNFLSSANAWGYRPQYWALRTNNGKVTTPCTDAVADGDGCVGPRYFDPVTKNESDNLIWTWMQSSIMDYAGEWTQDTVGIGAYDYAATRMFYGDVVAVHADPMYKSTSRQGQGMLAQTDTFGGILGIQPALGMERDSAGNTVPTTMPNGYTDYQANYKLITSCEDVADPSIFRPAGWNEARDGLWSPLLDGQIVSVGGKPTRCKGQAVDYQQWSALRQPTVAEGGTFYRQGAVAIDKQNRTRVPYGFATDNWADLGNVSVYRHDNGADPYEIYNFMISQPEVQHIFDDYRRGRTTFSVRSAADRTLTRYNEKMRDGAKGLGLFANIYRDVAAANGVDFDGLWSSVSASQFPINVLAAGMAFDHFARQFDRPQPGLHFAKAGDPVLRTTDSYTYQSQAPVVVIPNGASGYFADATAGTATAGQIGFGGKPLENELATDKGEYDVDYTQSCGSYYDKANAAMLLTESVDNFISSSRQDFLDGRYRAVGMADLFQEGYRRWLANNLTGDDFIKGPRLVATSTTGRPVVSKKYNRNDPTSGFPAQPIGWTSWLPTTGPTSCFPSNGTNICTGSPTTTDAIPNPLMPLVPTNVAVLDPQVGWEQQKFLIAWTLMYIPENAKQYWLDRMHIYELGVDANPELTARIEFHDPSGKVYVAQTFGTEMIFGKTVQKGVGARVLEWANSLMGAAYQTTPGPDLDGDMKPDWLIPTFVNGAPVVTSSGKALLLTNYMEVPYFIRQAMAAYHLDGTSQRGIY